MGKPVAITPEVELERALRLTVAREPANAEAMAALARLLGRHGAAEESIALYEIVAALRPGWFDILDELACAFIRRKDLIAADLWLSRITDPARQARRVEVRRWMRKEAKRLVLLAREHEAQGRTDEAFAAYALMAGHAPDVAAWRIEAARFFLAVGRYEAAQAHLESLDGDDPVPALLEVASALRQRHPNRRSPAFVTLLYRTAREELRAGRAALAEPVFRELTLIEPFYPHAWAELRAARLVLGKTEAAAAVDALWAAAAPKHAEIRAAALARPVSARGMLFDLNDRFPLVAKEAALTRVETPEALKRASDAYLVIDPGGRRTVGSPFFQVGDDRPMSKIRVTTSESFVLALDNALVAGRGAVITQKGELMADQFWPRKVRKYHGEIHDGRVAFGPALGREPIPVEYVAEPVFLCMGPTDASYGDWLNQFPPRLWLAEAAELDCRILVSRHLPPQYIEMLAALGVKPSRLVHQKDLRAFVYRRLYVPSWPFGPHSRPMANWLDVYRRAARPPAAGPRELLYLSRKHVDNRPLVNEEEIAELFVSYGFREISPERLGLAETLELFASPACIAGPWGSAFQTAVFSSVPPVALGLMPPYSRRYLHSVGVYMVEAGMQFGYVVGELRHDKLQPNTAPWYIAPDRARRAVETVLERLEREGAREPQAFAGA